MERLAIEGATVGLFDINDSAGKKVAEECGSNVSFYHVDVSDVDQCKEAIKQFVTATTCTSDGIHYLVNCAAYFGMKSPLNVEKKDWDRTFGVNVMGYSNMVQVCHPYMMKLTGDRSIVNVASGAGHRAHSEQMTYNTSKGAIIAMTKCMALDLSKDKIRVNSVSPGNVWTPALPLTVPSVRDREGFEQLFGMTSMFRKLIEPSELASAICFLLSEDASCITATDLPVDGGYLAMSAEGLGKDKVFVGTNS